MDNFQVLNSKKKKGNLKFQGEIDQSDDLSSEVFVKTNNEGGQGPFGIVRKIKGPFL